VQQHSILLHSRVNSTVSKPLLLCIAVLCQHLDCQGVCKCDAVMVLTSRSVVMMQCPINTWSSGGENVPCTQCPANTGSPSTSTNINACVCLPGYKPGSSGCVQCVSGEVCPGGTSVGEVVIVCPPGATSPPGSDSTADCVCQGGYGKLIMDKLFSLACCHMYVHLTQLVATCTYISHNWNQASSSPCAHMLRFACKATEL
jgi:hypothetical protein